MLQSTICGVMHCWSPEKSNILKKAFHEYLRDSVRYFVSMRNSICRAEAKLELQAVAHDGENVDADVSDQLQRCPVTNVCKSHRFDDE